MEWTTREEIIAACRTEPERVADVFLMVLQRLEDLERRVNETSSNSNKPPSSDGHRKPAPKSLRGKSDKPSGGQPGHPGHRLEYRDDPNRVIHHRPAACGNCGDSLADAVDVTHDRRQVFDLHACVEVTEHQAHTVRCRNCGNATTAAFPDEVPVQTQYGPQMKAFAAYCDAYQLLPSDRLCELIYDLTGHSLSEGTLYTLNEKLFGALEPYEASVRAALIAAPVVHFDESGLRVEGKLHWLHSAGTATLTDYTVNRGRGVKAMEAHGILPHFTGVAVHDGYRPYRGFRACGHALCNAHHERELRAVADIDGQPWAKALIDHLHTINAAVDTAEQAGADRLEAPQISGFMDTYDTIIQDGLAANPLPERPPTARGRRKKTKARNLVERLDSQRDSVLRFMHDFRVPYTNNRAEQDIRMIKVQQKISGAFRTLTGAQRFCRIRSYISTLKKQGLPVLTHIQNALQGRPFLPTTQA